MFFPLPRMELFKDRANWKYGFSLTAHEVTMRFAGDSKEDAQRWYNALKKRSKTVLLHLSRDFDVGKMLGRGAYTKVNLATHNETRTPYAIKSVLKTKLVESPKRIVCPWCSSSRLLWSTRSISLDSSSIPV